MPTYVIYREDNTIKGYMERIDDLILERGETFKCLDIEFDDFANGFVLSHNGQPCSVVFTKVGAEPVTVDVRAPGCSEVSVDVSGIPQIVTLTDGSGTIILPTDAPARFYLCPTDQTRFCPAGYGSFLVVVGDIP